MINMEKQLSRVVNIFLQLAKIPSPSGKEQKLRDFITSQSSALGYTVKKDHKGNLIITSKSIKKDGPILLFSAHMDTVQPAQEINPIIKSGYIYSDGTSVLGADDKSGIAAIIDVMHRIKKDKILYNQIRFVFTVEEEIDLLGAKELSNGDLKADMGFVLDADGDVGLVINKAPFLNSLKVEITGKAAHAGIAPETGINAIKVAAEAIQQISCGRIDQETTVNIGQISGGTASNIVPEYAEIIAESRSHNQDKLIEITKTIEETFKKTALKYHAKVKLKTTRQFNGLDIPKTHKVIEITRTAANNIDLPFKIVTSGGGSDAQIINNHGIPTVVLSTGMENIHSTKERIKIKNLEKLSDFLISIIKTANK